MADTFEDGIALYNQKNYKDALAVFLSLPSDSGIPPLELSYYAGLSYARLNRFDEALMYLEQVVTASSDVKRIHQCRLTLAVLYTKTDRPRLADYELQKLIEDGYETAEVYCSMAYIAWELDRKDEAVRHYETALSLKPECSTALNGLGYVLACIGKDLTKALSYCKKAVDKNPDSPAFLDSLGWVYYQLGLNKEAMTYIKRANSLLPGNSEISEHYEILISNGNAVRENNRISEHEGTV